MKFPKITPPSMPDRMEAVDVGGIPVLPVPVRVVGFMRTAPGITLETHGNLGPVPNGFTMDSPDEIRRATRKRLRLSHGPVFAVGQGGHADEPGTVVTKPLFANIGRCSDFERCRPCCLEP